MASYNIHDTVARPAWCVCGVGRLAQGLGAVCFHQFFKALSHQKEYYIYEYQIKFIYKIFLTDGC